MLKLSSKDVGAAPDTAELLKGGIYLESGRSWRDSKAVNLMQLKEVIKLACKKLMQNACLSGGWTPAAQRDGLWALGSLEGKRTWEGRDGHSRLSTRLPDLAVLRGLTYSTTLSIRALSSKWVQRLLY